MVQSILFFALGFLCAGFLALMVAPAIWRRAVSLTRRRIEASAPLTLSEIQADKDRIRAEYAMSTRRLEMSVKSFSEKAAAQLIEINRGHEALKELGAERARKNQALSELEAKGGALGAELRQREEQLQGLSDKLAETERAMKQRALELDQLGQMYDEASFSSSNRQIELVARESEVEKLADDIATLRDQRKEADRRHREIVVENKVAREALKAEQKKTGELDKKLDRLLATLADREEKLDRREKELARLRERLKGSSSAESGDAGLTPRASTLLSAANGGDIEKAIAKLDTDRERLEARLTSLARENKRLKTDISAFEASKSGERSDEQRESALLREQMSDLAAEVVSLTAMLDGPDSPIVKALEAPVDIWQEAAGERITSLADRVRALRKAASAG